MKWVVTHAVGYGGEEKRQNPEVLLPQFGDAYLVSVHQLLGGLTPFWVWGWTSGKQANPKIKAL